MHPAKARGLSAPSRAPRPRFLPAWQNKSFPLDPANSTQQKTRRGPESAASGAPSSRFPLSMRTPQNLFDFLAAMRTSCSAPSNAKEPAQQKEQTGDGALCRRGKNVFVHFIDAHSRRRPCDDKGDRRQGRKPGCCLFHSAASASVFNARTATSVCPAARPAVYMRGGGTPESAASNERRGCVLFGAGFRILYRQKQAPSCAGLQRGFPPPFVKTKADPNRSSNILERSRTPSAASSKLPPLKENSSEAASRQACF